MPPVPPNQELEKPLIFMYLAAIALMTFVGTVLLVSFNLGLSYFYSMPITPPDANAFRKSISDSHGEMLDWSTMDEAYRACKTKGCRPYINPSELANVSSDIRPFSLRPRSHLVYCNEIGRWRFVNSDKFGFDDNHDNRFDSADVVLLADSFGTSACIDESASIAKRIESTGINLLNLSIGGHQPLDELGTLIEYAPRFRTLVWFFYEGNDTFPAADIEFARQYLNPAFTQNLKSKKKEIQSIFDRLEHEWETESTFRLASRSSSSSRLVKLKDSLDHFFSPSISFVRSFVSAKEIPFDQELYELTLSAGKRYALERGAERFIVMYLPSWERFSWAPKSHPKRAVFNALSLSVKNAATKAGYEFVDVTPDLEEKPRSKIFPYDTHSHYTTEGYQIVSDRFLRTIVQH